LQVFHDCGKGLAAGFGLFCQFLDFGEGFTGVGELLFEGTGVFVGAGEGGIEELILGEEYLFLG
jgi:hypothetical protein